MRQFLILSALILSALATGCASPARPSEAFKAMEARKQASSGLITARGYTLTGSALEAEQARAQNAAPAPILFGKR